ncbi:hypothetical protein LA03_06045 [Burkholderia gladioli]|uniref:GNAT family N-acetyltransferase n=1 Tax=Burkholderia gladioli TaxID=28095 RepID=UPI000510392C|nr:GNAT family N-acetyltransferase [Burkholderia gladioli]KGE11128.1 hypothetical protein LA03_06045 [Burkholderia gladioli]
MAIPSFSYDRRGGQPIKPRIIVLEVRDRKTLDAAPIAWLLIERTETYKRDPRDNTVYEASICLTYERLTAHASPVSPGQDSFVAGYARARDDRFAVSLTSQFLSSGAVFLNPDSLRGQHIGTYLMNEIVTWCQQWPEALVAPVELLSGQADEANRARRNRFYEQFGLVFDYRDSTHREGKSRPMPVSELRNVESWKENLRVLNVSHFVNGLLHEHAELQGQVRDRERAVKNMAERIRLAEARPIRWAARRVWWRVVPLLQLLSVAALVGLAVWVRRQF